MRTTYFCAFNHLTEIMASKIVQELILGNRSALQQIYDQFHAKVYLFAQKHTKDTNYAEDIVHDVFLQIWEKRDKLSATTPLEAQLFVIARSMIINNYRRALTKDNVHQNFSNQYQQTKEADSFETEESIQKLNQAIELLPPKRKQVFKMAKIDGLSYEEVAKTLDISKSTVETQMVKALKFLREQMGNLPFF